MRNNRKSPPGYLIGDWQELEYDEALDKWVMSRKKSPSFPLIIVLLEGETALACSFCGG